MENTASPPTSPAPLPVRFVRRCSRALRVLLGAGTDEATITARLRAELSAELRGELATELRAVRAEVAMQLDGVRDEMHALAGSLHADALRSLDTLRRTVEAGRDPLADGPADAGTAASESLRAAVDHVTAEIQATLLARNEAIVRALEQELVRIAADLGARVAALEEATVSRRSSASDGRAAPAGSTAS